MTASLPDRLYTHVDRLAGLIGPRHLGRPESIRATLKLIESEFAALGDHVAHETYPLDDTSATNLVIERAGETRPEQIVLLGAHYDTVPETPGADDNASAVAVLIEVARLLQHVAHRRTIRFVAFACEEPPHFYTQTMGSEVHARGCRRRGEQIVGMLCLEMVGYFCDRPRSQRRPPGIPRLLSWFFPTRGDFVAAVGNLRSWRLCWTFRRGFRRAARFPLFSIVLPEAVHEIRLSDNGSFWDYGYPALMLTDTSFLRNPNYHLPTDTPDTLDYESMARVARGVAGGLSTIAGAVRK